MADRPPGRADLGRVPFDEHEDLTPRTVAAARDGDWRAAERVLHTFARDIEAGRTPHPDVTEYVAGAIRKIVDGLDPRKALGTARPPHRATTPEKQMRDWVCGSEVVERMARGESYENAIAAVADAEHTSTDTVQRAYGRLSEETRHIVKLLAESEDEARRRR